MSMQPSYYSLIAKAVAGLDPDAPGESRRVLYQRASAALLAQLRTINPPFTEAEITRERLALEEAVRKVEGEAAQHARDARVPTFSDLVADADDLGKAAAEVNEISVGVPSMIATGGATGSLLWWRSGGVKHPHDMPPFRFPPSPTLGDSSTKGLPGGPCQHVESGRYTHGRRKTTAGYSVAFDCRRAVQILSMIASDVGGAAATT